MFSSSYEREFSPRHGKLIRDDTHRALFAAGHVLEDYVAAQVLFLIY